MKKTYFKHFTDNKLWLVFTAIALLVLACLVTREFLGAAFFSCIFPFLFLGNYISWKAYLRNTNRNPDGSLKK